MATLKDSQHFVANNDLLRIDGSTSFQYVYKKHQGDPYCGKSCGVLVVISLWPEVMISRRTETAR